MDQARMSKQVIGLQKTAFDSIFNQAMDDGYSRMDKCFMSDGEQQRQERQERQSRQERREQQEQYEHAKERNEQQVEYGQVGCS